MLLRNEFDLHIINACNLSCDNCSVLDFHWKEKGHGVINSFMTLEQVENQVNLIKKWGYKLEKLKILGGEPTQHPKFAEIVDFLLDSGVAEQVYVCTNALNFTDKVLEACKKLDKVLISVYPMVDTQVPQLQLLKESRITEQFKKCHISVIASFDMFGVKEERWEEMHGYSPLKNWQNCWQKDHCRTIEGEMLYQCAVSYSMRKEGMHISEWGEKLDTPLKLCDTCWYPPKQSMWKSLKPKKDKRNLHKGMKFWNDYKNKIKVKEI